MLYHLSILVKSLNSILSILVPLVNILTTPLCIFYMSDFFFLGKIKEILRKIGNKGS